MLSVSLALALREAGLRWTPATGDRFMLPHRAMDDEVFVLSDMTIEVHDFPTGKVIGFNGVTEWALDSVQQEEAVWLPSEQQLRDRLGGLFSRLEAEPGPGPGAGFLVTIRLPDGISTHRGKTAGDAYGTALLAVLHSVTASSIAD